MTEEDQGETTWIASPLFFFFLSWLHPLRQQTTHRSHTLATRTAWNKRKLTAPPNGSSCSRNSFICYSTLQNSVTHTHTPPLNKPVRFYHTLGGFQFFFFFYNFPILSLSLDFTLYSLRRCRCRRHHLVLLFVGFNKVKHMARNKKHDEKKNHTKHVDSNSIRLQVQCAVPMIHGPTASSADSCSSCMLPLVHTALRLLPLITHLAREQS